MNTELQKWHHIWLYAKGWYLTSDDIVEDLKVLVGHHSAMDTKFLSTSDIIRVLCDIAIPLMMRDQNIATDRLRGIFLRLIQSYSDPTTRIVRELLSFIAREQVEKDGITLTALGNPDPNLLPLSDHKDSRLGVFREYINTLDLG